MEWLAVFSNLGWLSGIALVIGLALVIFEMFHPGFGAPGISGVILLILSILLTAKTTFQTLIMLIVILAILSIALTLVLRSATKGHLAQNIVLNEVQDRQSGYIGTEDMEYFLNKEGVAMTVLRPSGTADFDGVKLDVVSRGDFISKGERVRIVKVEGARIVVQSIEG